MRWLHVGGDAVGAKLGGCDGADRADEDFCEGGDGFLFFAQFSGDFQQMDNLDRRGEKGYVYFAVCEGGDGVAKGLNVFGERPLVDRDLRDDCATLSETG